MGKNREAEQFEFERVRKMSPREHLAWLRNEHTDEIPSEFVHGGRYKVRGNWFQGVTADLSNLMHERLISDELKPKVLAFTDYYCSKEFSEQLNSSGTTADDIKRANELIDEVLSRKPAEN